MNATIVIARAKTTAASTPGSFAPRVNAAQDDELEDVASDILCTEAASAEPMSARLEDATRLDNGDETREGYDSVTGLYDARLDPHAETSDPIFQRPDLFKPSIRL